MVNLEARGSIPRGEIFCCSESSGILLFLVLLPDFYTMLPSFAFLYLFSLVPWTPCGGRKPST